MKYLLFRHYYTADLLRLHAASFCMKHLLCPLCAIRRGAKALKAYLDRWEVIQQDRPALRPFLVTLTVKDGDNLAERFSGACQGSCRVSHAAAALISAAAASTAATTHSRSGLSVTAPIGDQSRVLPDQRFGFA